MGAEAVGQDGLARPQGREGGCQEAGLEASLAAAGEDASGTDCSRQLREGLEGGLQTGQP